MTEGIVMEIRKRLMVLGFALVVMAAVAGTLVKNSGVCTYNRLTGRDKEQRKEGDNR